MSKPQCPDELTIEFARELIIYLDPTANTSIIKEYWCWKELGIHFGHLRPKVEQYFEEADTGNPSYAAYYMVRDCESNRSWAERVIENDKTGNPSYAAYMMVRDCKSDRTWAERIIINDKTGDLNWAAYWMIQKCKSNRTRQKEYLLSLINKL